MDRRKGGRHKCWQNPQERRKEWRAQESPPTHREMKFGFSGVIAKKPPKVLESRLGEWRGVPVKVRSARGGAGFSSAATASLSRRLRRSGAAHVALSACPVGRHVTPGAVPRAEAPEGSRALPSGPPPAARSGQVGLDAGDREAGAAPRAPESQDDAHRVEVEHRSHQCQQEGNGEDREVQHGSSAQGATSRIGRSSSNASAWPNLRHSVWAGAPRGTREPTGRRGRDRDLRPASAERAMDRRGAGARVPASSRRRLRPPSAILHPKAAIAVHTISDRICPRLGTELLANAEPRFLRKVRS